MTCNHISALSSHDMPSHSIITPQITHSNQNLLVHQQSTEGPSPSIQNLSATSSAAANITTHTPDLVPKTSMQLRKHQQSIEHQSEVTFGFLREKRRQLGGDKIIDPFLHFSRISKALSRWTVLHQPE
uniref:Uncharacterized protein n=1 Tax=Heterorhabditis bacteriophora TaxID=37862 RepID=A0A1I7XGT6_HETBA